MRKNGGIIKKLNEEAQEEILKIIQKQKGSAVPISRESNQFIVEMLFPAPGKEQQDAFQVAKKTFRGKGSPTQAHGNDPRSENRWESFWDKEGDSGFTWQA